MLGLKQKKIKFEERKMQLEPKKLRLKWVTDHSGVEGGEGNQTGGAHVF